MIMVMGLTASAQHRGGKDGKRMAPEDRVTMQVTKMTKALDLTEKQQGELKQLLTEKNKEHEAIIAKRKAFKEGGEKPSREEREAIKARMTEERKAVNEKIRKILTPEQFEKFEKIKEQRQERMKNRKQKRN